MNETYYQHIWDYIGPVLLYGNCACRIRGNKIPWWYCDVGSTPTVLLIQPNIGDWLTYYIEVLEKKGKQVQDKGRPE